MRAEHHTLDVHPHLQAHARLAQRSAACPVPGAGRARAVTLMAQRMVANIISVAGALRYSLARSPALRSERGGNCYESYFVWMASFLRYCATLEARLEEIFPDASARAALTYLRVRAACASQDSVRVAIAAYILAS